MCIWIWIRSVLHLWVFAYALGTKMHSGYLDFVSDQILKLKQVKAVVED